MDRYNETNYPTYQEFEQEFKAEIESIRYEFQVQPLTGGELHKRLRKRKDSKAGGSDSWRTVELKMMTLPINKLLAELLNFVEKVGIWPKVIGQCSTTLLYKGSGKIIWI